MKQVNRNRLSQLQFSVLAQIAKDKDANALLAGPIAAKRTLFRAIPSTICDHASHILPDHSIAALETQPVSLNEIVKWHLAPNGGHLYFADVKHGQTPLTIHPREDQSVVSSKQSAVKQLAFSSKEVRETIDRVVVADQYYAAAVKKLRDDQGTGKEEEDLEIVGREAGNLSMVYDHYALKELFYLKTRNRVNQDGFDTSNYDKEIKKDRASMPITANPAYYLRPAEADDRDADDDQSTHNPGM